MTGLYERLLGSAWKELDAAVRRLHGEHGAVRAAGRFRIWRGDGRLARCLLWWAHMPPAGEQVDTRLNIRVEGPGERWERSFNGWLFQTTQCECPERLLAERVGSVELRFRLEATGGALVYHQVGAALCLGPLRLPLPRWLAPSVIARESPDDAPNRTRIAVWVTAPLAGLLISYHGTLAMEGAEG